MINSLPRAVTYLSTRLIASTDRRRKLSDKQKAELLMKSKAYSYRFLAKTYGVHVNYVKKLVKTAKFFCEICNQVKSWEGGRFYMPGNLLIFICRECLEGS